MYNVCIYVSMYISIRVPDLSPLGNGKVPVPGSVFWGIFGDAKAEAVVLTGG